MSRLSLNNPIIHSPVIPEEVMYNVFEILRYCEYPEVHLEKANN
jgi:hypothetical protein